MTDIIDRLIQKEVDNAVRVSVKDNKIETAKKMIAKNKPTDEIVEFTGLDIETVEELREQQKHE